MLTQILYMIYCIIVYTAHTNICTYTIHEVYSWIERERGGQCVHI